MGIDERLSKLAKTIGSDYYGVAELSPAKTEIVRQGGEELARYPFAISVGIALMHSIVDELPNRQNRAFSVEYKHHAYDVVNARLDEITSRISSAIQNEGYFALPVPASERYDSERICAVFSHKLAAHLAGLGWIGKSCLLVTPGSGPRVRWATVLTDAPLTPTGTPMEQRCGSCHECVDICPAKAFTGRSFTESEPREARFDARACEDYFSRMESEGKVSVCGLCLYACPHGKKAAKELHV